jgi:predicted ATPase
MSRIASHSSFDHGVVDAERAALVAAYHDARGGGARGLLVSGAPGGGRRALLDELRRPVTEQGGWLVTGKFDQYRHDYAAMHHP